VDRRPSPRPAAFLDRDGVLNAAIVVGGIPRAPGSPDTVAWLPGAIEACRQLREAGLALVVVTNQPDIARGNTTVEAVDAINRAVTAPLAVDRVEMCPHDDADHCACRKPAAGMLLRAAAAMDLDLGRSTMVGDRWRDIEAGKAAGVATVFVDHHYQERKPQAPDLVVGALLDAVPFMIQRALKRE
jgi:D-glycero-D-manno-heptose 1,7-bisphosphate phosphatase